MDTLVTQEIPPAVIQLVERLRNANGDVSTVSVSLEDDATQVYNILVFGKKQDLSPLGTCHWYGVQLTELTAKRSGEIVRSYIQVTLSSTADLSGVLAASNQMVN